MWTKKRIIVITQIFVILTIFLVINSSKFDFATIPLSSITDDKSFTLNTAASWSNATAISDVYGWNDGDSGRPSVAVDGSGNMHVVWSDATDGAWEPDYIPTKDEPIIIAPLSVGDISRFLLSPLGLGIIAGFGMIFLILVAVVINKNKTIKELKKISKPPTSKKSMEK